MSKQKKTAFQKENILHPKYPVPICFTCYEIIRFKQILITPTYQMLFKYDCGCKKKNMMTVFDDYYARLCYLVLKNYPVCESCGKNLSSYYCCKCSFMICRTCINKHKNHVLLDFKINNIKSYCTKHPKLKRTYYCIDCQKDLCTTCKKDNHNNHKVQIIKEYYEEVK